MSNLEGELEELFPTTLEMERPRIVTVYRIISKEKLNHYLEEGAFVATNAEGFGESPAWKESDIYRAKVMTEDIFDQVLKNRLGKKPEILSRRNCIFAFPENPLVKPSGFSFDPDSERIVEMNVDARHCLVCSAEVYTEAVIQCVRLFERRQSSELRLSQDQEQSFLRSIMAWAEDYWDDALTLSDFLDLDENYRELISFPEVLIFNPVPPELITEVDLTSFLQGQEDWD